MVSGRVIVMNDKMSDRESKALGTLIIIIMNILINVS